MYRLRFDSEGFGLQFTPRNICVAFVTISVKVYGTLDRGHLVDKNNVRLIYWTCVI